MLCPNCKKQIPDDSDQCQHCGTPIDHKEQVSKEISLRRYQRWIFYSIIVLVFIGMVGIIIRIYNANAEISENFAGIQERYQEKEEELQQTKQSLETTKEDLVETKTTLEEKTREQRELEQQTENLRSELENYDQNYEQVENRYEDCQLDLEKADSNIYKLIVELGQGVSNQDLARIPLADSNLVGDDSDSDGLSDVVEESLGTDPQSEDSDGDGYTDMEEVLSGFNPTGEGRLPWDEGYAAQMKGKILLQVDGDNEAWYVAGNGKRYFLGTPANAFRTMRQVEYWTENPPEETTSSQTQL
jgi:predicted nucleic acid-binding Zn ribbon protein